MVGIGEVWTAFHYNLDDVKVVNTGFSFEDVNRIKRQELLNYMRKKREEIAKDMDFIIDIPGSARRFSDLMMLCDNASFDKGVIKYLLSSDRMYSPKRVSTYNKKYGWIDKILKSERGERSCLSRGFVEGWISNVRLIGYGDR